MKEKKIPATNLPRQLNVLSCVYTTRNETKIYIEKSLRFNRIIRDLKRLITGGQFCTK